MQENMQGKSSIKAFFSSKYDQLEKAGPFRKRAIEEKNESLALIIALSNRWRRYPDTEGKRLVGKILSLYDRNDPLLAVVLEDNPVSFEKYYLETSHKISRLRWLEIASLLGRENLVSYFINLSEIDVNDSSNLLAYGLSVGNTTFAYRLALSLKENGYTHPECLNLYNKCPHEDLRKIQSLFAHQNTNEFLPLKNL